MATFVALLVIGVGCSKDDIVGNASAEAVEAGLNSRLNDTVHPLLELFKAVPVIVNGGASFRSTLGGVSCPSTAGICGGGGSVVCTPGISTLTFDFDECVVVTGDAPMTLDGGLVVTPGSPTISITLNSLFINDSAAMSGTGTVTVTGCTYVIDVTSADDVSVTGQIIQCDSDPYPTVGSSVELSFDNFLIVVNFDSSSVATAVASSGSNVVANCDINLAVEPFSSSCEAP